MSNSPDEPFAERHRGRGAGIRPENRFETLHVIQDYEQLPGEEQDQTALNTEYYDDASKSVVSENNSPDLLFRYSLNPYRGCIHGCPNYLLPLIGTIVLTQGKDIVSWII